MKLIGLRLRMCMVGRVEEVLTEIRVFVWAHVSY